MTTEVRYYRVECKNSACDAVLNLGYKLARALPAGGGEVAQVWKRDVAGTNTCPRCAQAFEYRGEDCLEFKSDPSVV